MSEKLSNFLMAAFEVAVIVFALFALTHPHS